MEAIKRYAGEHGIRIAKVFREEGVSGTKDLDNRPALSDLMLALHGNGIKVVLVERLDRLARDLMIQESIIGEFQRNGFELISVAEPDLLSDDPTRKLMRQFMGAIAEWEKSMIVRKLRAARQRTKAKTGRCEGRKPYGAYPGESDVIARMRTLRSEGLAYDVIAERLNQEGVRTRTEGKRWFGMAVARILKAQEGPTVQVR